MTALALKQQSELSKQFYFVPGNLSERFIDWVCEWYEYACAGDEEVCDPFPITGNGAFYFVEETADSYVELIYECSMHDLKQTDPELFPKDREYTDDDWENIESALENSYQEFESMFYDDVEIALQQLNMAYVSGYYGIFSARTFYNNTPVTEVW